MRTGHSDVIFVQLYSNDSQGLTERRSLTGDLGRRVTELMGVSVDDMLRSAETVALMVHGAHWYLSTSKDSAKSLFDTYSSYCKRWVLLGQRVWQSFGIPPDSEPLEVLESEEEETSFLLVPTPSGKTPWYREPANVRRAAVAIREFLDLEVRDGDTAQVPPDIIRRNCRIRAAILDASWSQIASNGKESRQIFNYHYTKASGPSVDWLANILGVTAEVLSDESPARIAEVPE